MAFIISLIIQAKHNHILFILGAVVWYTSLFFFVLGACTPLAAVAQGKGWAKNGGVSLTADSLKAAHGSVPHFEHGRGHFGRCVALAGPWRYRAGDDPSRADPQYIVKPFSTPELLARVDRVMQTRRMLQEHFRKELKVEPAAGCRPSPRPISGVWPSPPRRGRGALQGLGIGALIGGGGGALVGLITGLNCGSDDWICGPGLAAVSGIIYGALGGYVGLVTGAVRGSRTVYHFAPGKRPRSAEQGAPARRNTSFSCGQPVFPHLKNHSVSLVNHKTP